MLVEEALLTEFGNCKFGVAGISGGTNGVAAGTTAEAVARSDKFARTGACSTAVTTGKQLMDSRYWTLVELSLVD